MDGNTTYAQTTCTIGGDVILPTISKRGYIFRGWSPFFYRGRFPNWSDIPSYSSEYIDIPIENDRIVVVDASDYITPEANTHHKFKVVNLNDINRWTIQITNELGIVKKYYFADGFNGVWKAIDDDYSLRYNSGNPGKWRIKSNNEKDTRISIDGRIYEGDVLLVETNYPITQEVSVGIPAATGQHQGMWMFVYHGNWATDGKYGWKPVYQITNQNE